MRINVGISIEHEPDTVAEALRDMGAESIQGPTTALPDVLSVTFNFPEDDLESTVKRVEKLPGVRYAEPDQLQFILD